MAYQRVDGPVVIPLHLLRSDSARAWMEIRKYVIQAAKGRFSEDAGAIQDMMVAIDVKLYRSGVPAGCGLVIQWDQYDIPRLDFLKMPRCCLSEEISCRI